MCANSGLFGERVTQQSVKRSPDKVNWWQPFADGSHPLISYREAVSRARSGFSRVDTGNRSRTVHKRDPFANGSQLCLVNTALENMSHYGPLKQYKINMPYLMRAMLC